MAYGTVILQPSGTHNQIFIPAGQTFPTLAALNPNDGICYIARDRDVLNAAYGAWDWKVPSQSYAVLPGPFQSVGLYYLDQSGAGRQGEITFYPINQKINFPDFKAIGRALVAQQTALDVTEGVQPANPGAGILRLWADGTNRLHALTPGGIDALLNGGNHGFAAGIAANPTVAAGASVNIPDLAVTLTTIGNVLIILQLTASSSIVGPIAPLNFSIDGIQQNTPGITMNFPWTAGSLGTYTLVVFASPAPGSHIYRGMWGTNAGTLTGYTTERFLTVVELS